MLSLSVSDTENGSLDTEENDIKDNKTLVEVDNKNERQEKHERNNAEHMRFNQEEFPDMMNEGQPPPGVQCAHRQAGVGSGGWLGPRSAHCDGWATTCCFGWPWARCMARWTQDTPRPTGTCCRCGCDAKASPRRWRCPSVHPSGSRSPRGGARGATHRARSSWARRGVVPARARPVRAREWKVYWFADRLRASLR